MTVIRFRHLAFQRRTCGGQRRTARQRWQRRADRAGYQEGASAEDRSARTPYTTEFVNPDGTRTRRIYQDIAFVPDAHGALTPVDATLRRGAGEPRWTPTASLERLSFATLGNSTELARLDLGDGVSVGFGVDGAAAVQPAVLG